MIATSLMLLASLIAPLRYAFASEASSPTMRPGVGVMSMSAPPIFALRSRNCAVVITPCLHALRPYWIPTLPNGCPAKPWPAFCSIGDHTLVSRGPSTLIIASRIEQRTPPGFDDGLYTTFAGTHEPLGAVALLKNSSSATIALTGSGRPSTAAHCAGVQTIPVPHFVRSSK